MFYVNRQNDKIFISYSLTILRRNKIFPILIFQSMHAENAEKRRRTNVMISSIAIVFFVSWLPLNVFDLLMKLDPKVRYGFLCT